jgi:hypothetical protein
VALYRPGKRWDARIPTPVYVGNPVASSIDGLAKALASGR